ncbi:hypothetical protein HBJ58_19950 [Halomonas desiderata]|uniref:ATP-grasp fold amidoligase family protein n=1 Tax=Billgrantia desiderata TaxID=52021 RepID=UPI00174AA971|nr:hypothetical protein [Halomonas desiderata]
MERFHRNLLLKKISESGMQNAFEESLQSALSCRKNAKEIFDFWGRYLKNRIDEEGNKNRFRKLVSVLSSSELRECYGRTLMNTEFSSAASFTESLNRRKRLAQLGGARHEWKVASKKIAPKFCESLGIRAPRIIHEEFSHHDLPFFRSGVLKPLGGGGSNGVFLKLVDVVIDVKEKIKYDASNFDLKLAMHECLESGRVNCDKWFVEELVKGREVDDFFPVDLKFYTFYGKVALVLEIKRFPESKYCWWTRAGEVIDTGKYNNKHFKGKGFSTSTLKMAELIGENIPAPFVRIDFIQGEYSCLFGEITPSPGDYDLFNVETDTRLGEEYILAEERLIDDLLNGKSFEVFKTFSV